MDNNKMIFDENFFGRDCLDVAKDLVGKILVRTKDGKETKLRITETESYRGEEDTACHAHKGRTKRTETLYMKGGTIYVYLCYGMHYLLNFVTEKEENPQAVLIRACEIYNGPGKLTKHLEIDKSFNNQSIIANDRLHIEDDGQRFEILCDRRVGINYAAQEDIDKLWRFKMGKKLT